MELRVLQYFLAVAQENSISGAAEFLHLSQPTLSRQLKELEEELGKQLFIRGNRGITLTEEGMILRKRAEEVIELIKKAEPKPRKGLSVHHSTFMTTGYSAFVTRSTEGKPVPNPDLTRRSHRPS